MHEISTTRMNHLIDPTLHIWGWEVPVDLFLGGLVAGLMIIFGVLSLRNDEFKEKGLYRAMPMAAIFLLSAGMVALFLDLEHREFVFRLYTTFQITSPMSWGSWILLLVYPVLFLSMLLNEDGMLVILIPLFGRWSKTIRSKRQTIKFICFASIIGGVLLGMYTGVLLSSLGARPLWNTALLWLLFLVSGLSSAAALIHLISQQEGEKELLMKAYTGLLAAELFILAMISISFLSGGSVQQQAIHILLTGDYAPVFWTFIVLLGIVLPLFLLMMQMNKKIPHTRIAPIAVLFGGLLLRFVIVYAGQLSHWR